MKKRFNLLTKEAIKMVKTSALARKHKCSDVYVRCVLTGVRAGKTVLAQNILKDANDIVAIYQRKFDVENESKR